MEQSYTIKNSIDRIKKSLTGFYPENEIQSFIFIIFEQLLNFSKVDLHVKSDTKLTESVYFQINEIINYLKQYKPIQYIFNETEFCGLKLKVNPGVLIPRPETEELVHWLLHHANTRVLSILDIGTGSGCIAIALAKSLPGATVDAMDISANAIEIANENALRHKVNILFYQADILNFPENCFLKDPSKSSIDSFSNMDKAVKKDVFRGALKTYDIIVSNPPYVKEIEKKTMQKNVVDFEPHQALFVPDNNSLIFYEAISNIAMRKLNKEGSLFFEINEAMGQCIKSLLEKKKFKNIIIKKDIHGKDRMVKAQLP